MEPKIISVIISKLASPGLTNFGPQSEAKAPGITTIAINGKSQKRVGCICAKVGASLEARTTHAAMAAKALQKKNPKVISIAELF